VSYFSSHLKRVTSLPCETYAADIFDFSKLLMVFVGVSKFEKTNPMFVDPGVKTQHILARRAS